MRASHASIATLALASACYHGVRTSRDIDDAWRGHPRAELEARWGKPSGELQQQQLYLRWNHTHQNVELPSVSAHVDLHPDEGEASFEVRPGHLWPTTTDAIAVIAPDGTIAEMHGTSVEWGPPAGANLHWGPIFGLHAGMGRLDDTGTPLPSGGAYIGGMLGPRFGLVGTFAFVSGTSASGSAIGMAAGMSAQYFTTDRVFVRGGPVAVLSWSPGFDATHAGAGVDVSAGYAFVRAGTFALDLRAELVMAPGVAFGSIGVGVNRD